METKTSIKELKFNDLFKKTLQDIHRAENTLATVLPLINKVISSQLIASFEKQLHETQLEVLRIVQLFETLKDEHNEKV